MSKMGDKRTGIRFHIQFSQTDPAHLHVADILKNKARGDKAKYIVNAILYYESHCGESEIKHMTLIDEKQLEAAINRILQDREKVSTSVLPAPPPPSLNQLHKQPQPVEDINNDDDLDTIGEHGLNAINNAMKMFKKMK